MEYWVQKFIVEFLGWGNIDIWVSDTLAGPFSKEKIYVPVRSDELKTLGYLELTPTRRMRVIDGKALVAHSVTGWLPPTSPRPENLVHLSGVAMFGQKPP